LHIKGIYANDVIYIDIYINIYGVQYIYIAYVHIACEAKLLSQQLVGLKMQNLAAVQQSVLSQNFFRLLVK